MSTQTMKGAVMVQRFTAAPTFAHENERSIEKFPVDRFTDNVTDMFLIQSVGHIDTALQRSRFMAIRTTFKAMGYAIFTVQAYPDSSPQEYFIETDECYECEFLGDIIQAAIIGEIHALKPVLRAERSLLPYLFVPSQP